MRRVVVDKETHGLVGALFDDGGNYPLVDPSDSFLADNGGHSMKKITILGLGQVLIMNKLDLDRLLTKQQAHFSKDTTTIQEKIS